MEKIYFNDTKPHYEALDGLRGVAAIVVVVFHLFEIFSGGDHTKQIINHGYLAVDFFFMLSGFVVAHAYDNRWNSMTIVQFLKRRIIRLQPLLVIGIIIGGLCYYFSASDILFPKIAQTPLWQLIIVVLLGIFMIPVPPGNWEIRGWTEMYPLNGPAWSLFYEYIANILYALILRKLSTNILMMLMLISGGFLTYMILGTNHGDVIGGWALNADQLFVGSCRLAFPFLAGMVLSRSFKSKSIKLGFFWSSLWLIVLLSLPRFGDKEHFVMNGLYDLFCIVVLFPVVIFVGASASLISDKSRKLCQFLGQISYPLYITHFPFLYIYYSWVVVNKKTITDAVPVGLGIIAFTILLAYLLFKYVDLPVRKWLSKKFQY